RGIKKNKIGIQGRGIYENHPAVEIDRFLGIGIHHSYPYCLALFLIIDNGFHNRKRPECHIACLLRPWQRRGIAAKIPTERAASLTKFTVLALYTSLFQMDRLRLGQMGTSCTDDMTIIIF